MERDRNRVRSDRRGPRQLDEDTSYLLYLFVLAENVLIAQQVAETELLGLDFGLGARVKRTVLRPQLLGGVTCHPENLFVRHRSFSPRGREAGSWLRLTPHLAVLPSECTFGSAARYRQ